MTAWNNNRHIYNRAHPKKCLVCGYIKLTPKVLQPCTENNKGKKKGNFKEMQPKLRRRLKRST